MNIVQRWNAETLEGMFNCLNIQFPESFEEDQINYIKNVQQLALKLLTGETVVRCKDCKHHYCQSLLAEMQCTKYDCDVDDDDFCAAGEKFEERKDETN